MVREFGQPLFEDLDGFEGGGGAVVHVVRDEHRIDALGSDHLDQVRVEFALCVNQFDTVERASKVPVRCVK